MASRSRAGPWILTSSSYGGSADTRPAIGLHKRLGKAKSEVGIEPHNLLAATPQKLASALTPGGIMPELRALRLKQVAMQVKDEFGGDLRAGLTGPSPRCEGR